MRKLTRRDIEALAQVGDGADITSPMLAKTLRELERHKPALLKICRPMNQYDGAGRLPYFGAKLTAAGEQLVAERSARHVVPPPASAAAPAAQVQSAFAACKSIRFAFKNAARYGGEWNLNDLIACDRLAREALGETSAKPSEKKGGAS